MRSRALVQFVLVGGLICAAPAFAQPAERCRQDALEEWYCAADPVGTAVVDALGRVVCAPGASRKEEEGGGWLCSSEPGGNAAITPEGPACDGGECRSPEATACKKI